MKTRWTLIKMILGILILGFLVSFSAIRHAGKTLKEIRIHIDNESGLRFINDSLVTRIIEGKPLYVRTVNLGSLDVAKVERALDEDPFVKKAHVFQEVDGGLNVKIEQEIPVLRVNTGTDEYYLSEELAKIPLSNLYASEVLLVGGRIDEDDYLALSELSKFIKVDKLLTKHIIAVKKQAPNSFILLVNKGDYIIEFGELENFEDKFKRLKLFYDQYLGEVGLDYYEKISLKFNNQIVATKRKSDEK